jgi:MFS family permease
MNAEPHLPVDNVLSAQDRDAAAGRCDAERSLSLRSRRGLDWVNFFLADVQTGVGPFLAIFLAGVHWNPQQIGIALTAGGLAGIAAQTPAGALVDRLRAKLIGHRIYSF